MNAVISSGYLTLKADDADKVRKIEPGTTVDINMRVKIRSVSKDQQEADSKETTARVEYDVSEIRVARANNAFEAMAATDE